jgi:hypothetical protein
MLIKSFSVCPLASLAPLHSSLWQAFANYGIKKFYNNGPRMNPQPHFILTMDFFCKYKFTFEANILGSHDIQHNDIKHNDTEHTDIRIMTLSIMTLSIMTLSIITLSINHNQHKPHSALQRSV